MNPVPSQPTPHSRNVFDNLSSWLIEPVPTFSAWMQSHPIEDSTREVKGFMWGKWCRWLEGQGLGLGLVESGHLAKFFAAEKIEKAHRQRYLRLIEVVYIHLNLLGLSRENPGTQAGYERLGKGENDDTVFLSAQEKERVERVIGEWLRSHVVGHHDSAGSERKRRNGRKKQDWVRVRDASVCSVMMGGGATVMALERLTVSCTNCLDGRIALPRKGGADYEALLLPIGQTALDVWLRRRRELGGGIGDRMFPADQSSRKNPSTLTDTAGMHASTIFRAVRGLLKEAGITGARACGQTLRNTYAATLIDLGFTDDEVASYMGFFDPLSALRLRASWTRARGAGVVEDFPTE